MSEKYKLVNSITPLYKMNYRCGKTNIWIKRDDLLDFAFGGNKVRLFEYIIPLILKNKAERVVTYGSRHSNFIRVASTVCSLLNIECDLIILDDQNTANISDSPNLKLVGYLSPHIIYCSTENAHDYIDEYQDTLNRKGVNYFWIPGGGHIPEASFGYVDASHEIEEQLNSANINIDSVFLPCGTGTTQAGLVYGFSDNINIVGISISRSIERCLKEISDTLSLMGGKADNLTVIRDDTDYGRITPEITEIIKEVAKSDGIFLDPVYNARAFLGMLNYLHQNPNLDNVLYLNTGGQPNLF